MCLPNVTRLQVQALPPAERGALQLFAEARLAKAENDHAREFWTGLIDACLPTYAYVAVVKARTEVAIAAQTEAPKE